MRLKNKISNIKKDQIKRKNYLNSEIKKIVLKSIIQNLNIKPNLRALAWKKIIKFKLNSSISKQNNNLCLKSGRYKGVLRLTNTSRHEIKKLGLVGLLQNIKIRSW